MKKPLGFFGVRNAVGADVNDCGTGPDPVRFHVAGFAHGGDEDIGAAEDIGQVASFGMADGDGGVGMHEEEGHGLADDVAAAEDDGVCAFDFDFVAAKKFHAAGGGAGDQAGAAADEATEIDGMKTVHVFCGIDGLQNTLGIHLGRERKLDKNAVDVVVAIQVFDDGEEIEGGHGGRRREERAGEAELLAGGDLAFDVELRGGIFSDEDRREAWANAGRGEQPDFVTQLGENLVADSLAIQGACGHSWLAFIAEGEAARPMRARRCVLALARGERRNVKTSERWGTGAEGTPPVFCKCCI